MTEKEKNLLSVIKKAGKIMLSASDIEDGVKEKDGYANFVTEYDVKVQSYLISEIKKLFVNAEFLAEEQEGNTSVLQSECCFVIDPIDGTTNFIHDLRHSAVSVAMLSHGETVLGIVYNPYLDEMFFAKKGAGAFLNGRRISVSNRTPEQAIVAFGTSPYVKDKTGEATMKLAYELFMRCADIRRAGSAALDLAYVAAGRHDLFFEIRLSPWDFAAAELMITEAGGIITDMKGAALSLENPTPVIAGNPVAFPTLLEITKEY